MELQEDNNEFEKIHSTDKKSDSSSNNDIIAYITDQTTQEFCCLTCSFKSRYRPIIERHLLVHLSDKSDESSSFDRSSSDSSVLRNFRRKHRM